MRKNKIIIVLIIGALLSGCVGQKSITGTYAQQNTTTPSITFYDDGTWLFESTAGGNSGVYKIHDNEIVITGQLMAGKMIILDNGTLMDPDTKHVFFKIK